MRLQNTIFLFLLLALPIFLACDKDSARVENAKPVSKPASENEPNSKQENSQGGTEGQTGSPSTLFRIDGQFDEWSAEPIVVDPAGDASGKFDLGSVWAQAADGYLYVSFELNNGTEFNLHNGAESDGELQLTIHQGNDSRQIDFRKRQLIDRRSPQQVIPWAQVRFTCQPTYASNRYELQVQLDNDDPDLRIEFSGSDSLDTAIAVPVDQSKTEIARASIDRDPNCDFRIANLNTLNNGLADEQRGKVMHRLLAGAKADIYTFQEEWKPKDFYESLKPLRAQMGIEWFNAHWSGGCAIISRLAVEKLPMKLDRAAAGLVELESGQHVVVISVHFKSRGHVGSDEDNLRIQQATQLVGEIKRMRTGAFGEKAQNASIAIVGDYNLVGSRKSVDLLNAAGFQDQIFRNPVTGTAYTWRDDVTTFPPSRLDWICHAGLESLQSIVLDTKTLDAQTLSDNNLQESDSESTDHLMLIGDFRVSDR